MAQIYQVNRRRLVVGGVAWMVWADIAMARNANWATPVKLDGGPNLNRVAPNLYRSAQPTADGFKAAQDKLHVKPTALVA